MQVFALTGGIATGKSTAGKMISRLMPTSAFFDCDESVQSLLQKQTVLEEISDALGRSVIKADGSLDRAALRKLVFENETSRRKLEIILHPKVRKECLEKLDFYSKTMSTTLFVADVPLLFESGFDFGQELNLVVATSQATQRTRLKARNHFEDRMISSISKRSFLLWKRLPERMSFFGMRGVSPFWRDNSYDS
jgi:dephospho-CoA kinase